MSKKTLVELNLFDKLFKSFLKSKSEKKELDFIFIKIAASNITHTY